MENINEIISEVKNSKILGSEDEAVEVLLSEQRRQEAELRKYELTEDNPMISGEKYNGINAKIECDSYYNPDEAVKQCMIKYESQASEAIKSVKVPRVSFFGADERSAFPLPVFSQSCKILYFPFLDLYGTKLLVAE